MTSVMESVGFSTISSEWWHFEYKGDGGYMDANLDYDSLKYKVKN
jgi:D-alanyl-D-alanine dipeptidase